MKTTEKICVTKKCNKIFISSKAEAEKQYQALLIKLPKIV